MEFTPKDPDFDCRVRANVARQHAMAALGIDISRLSPGAIELTMPYSVAYTQQHGFVHAEIIVRVCRLLPDASGRRRAHCRI
jgi:acyl-coenzyme A thioesterase PaaI-like protein